MERYRYNLSAELLSYIKINFINRLDNDKFDNSWNEWITMERVKVLFKIEEKRLIKEGWVGVINDKIKTSIKYYYMNNNEQRKSTKKKRRNYVHMDDKMGVLMNNFINDTKINKPSSAYEKFIKENELSCKKECLRLKGYMKDKETLIKIKKTFKNKFYLKNKT
tara:strand:- start:1217 stop:1708 length:492 start_codon:yes stop_codon:yes gene_type:complete